MPRYEDQAKIIKNRRAAASTSGSANFQAEQQRQSADAARRRREAQRRRQQAEQQARQQQQRRKTAAKARIAEIAKRRTVRHTVKRGESAAQIANQYGATEKGIADQTTGGLRAGTVLDFQVPGEKTPRADLSGLEGGPQTVQAESLPEDRLSWFTGAKKDFAAAGKGSRAEKLIAFADDLGTRSSTGVGGAVGEPPDTRRFRGRGATPGQTAAYKALASERGQRVHSAELTWRALSYVWNTGDWELRPKIVDPFTLRQMSLGMQQKLIDELGYYIDEEGYARRIEFEEEDYGMGAGGGGGGGGGGGYTPPTYTKGISSGRGGATGVRTRGTNGQLRGGYKERSSWRI